MAKKLDRTMKYLFTLILITTLSCVKGQTSNIPYLAQQELKKFTGKWQYTSNDTIFTINLILEKKYNKGSGNGFYIDVIVGDYILKKGEQILQSSSAIKPIRAGGFVDKKLNNNKIDFLITDLGKKSKRGTVTFEIQSGQENIAKWQLSNNEGIHIGTYDYSFSLPLQAMFKKVN
ncbi:DUF6705 family protein [Mucilaginibacter litoreus]|uniref:DUF6705 family protein n=1 Tax=Mucilaginibacter litoreus TaxID=1048221 RepID=A0ABW3AVB4_9SPHI